MGSQVNSFVKVRVMIGKLFLVLAMAAVCMGSWLPNDADPEKLWKSASDVATKMTDFLMKADWQTNADKQELYHQVYSYLTETPKTEHEGRLGIGIGFHVLQKICKF